MSISNVSSLFASQNVQATTATPVAPGSAGVASAAGVTVDISKPGQLMSELSSLAQSDPAQFKAVAADIATQLQNAASSQTGSSADFLNKLADKFSAASKSGDLSDLKPAQGPHHGHGGHRAHGAAASGQGATPGAAADSVGQIVQSIISTALSSASSAASSSGAPAAG